MSSLSTFVYVVFYSVLCRVCVTSLLVSMPRGVPPRLCVSRAAYDRTVTGRTRRRPPAARHAARRAPRPSRPRTRVATVHGPHPAPTTAAIANTAEHQPTKRNAHEQTPHNPTQCLCTATSRLSLSPLRCSRSHRRTNTQSPRRRPGRAKPCADPGPNIWRLVLRDRRPC
jgi:hypothetical protein